MTRSFSSVDSIDGSEVTELAAAAGDVQGDCVSSEYSAKPDIEWNWTRYGWANRTFGRPGE